MSMTRPLSRLFLPLVCLLASPALYAATLTTVSNLNQTSGGSAPLSANSYNLLGSAFTVGSADLELLSARVSFTLANPGLSANVQFFLYDNNVDRPGSLLTTFTGPTDPGNGVVTYGLATSYLLTQGSTYWLMGLNTGTTLGPSWYFTNSDSEDASGVAGWTISSTAAESTNSGSTYTLYPGPQMFSIQVYRIPEPSVAFASLLGFVAFGGVARRRHLQHKVTKHPAV